MTTVDTDFWRTAEADATEAKADFVEAAILALRRIDGIFEKDTQVDRDRVVMINRLEVEAVNLRSLADRQRGNPEG